LKLTHAFPEVLAMKYLKIAFLFVLAWGVNALSGSVLQHMAHLGGTETAIAQTLWCLSLFLGFGWACSKVAEGTVLPSFTLQLLVGIVLHDALSPLSVQLTLAVVVCTALAAIILKSGGDEIERQAFLQIAYPTLMIAVVGYLVTFFVTYVLLTSLGLEGKTAALLAAILGSTDPAALIPTLKQLTIKAEYRRVSDMAVAESALNDAVGAIFTSAIVAMVLGGAQLDSVGGLAGGLFSQDNLVLLGQQFVWGTIAGLVGWLCMYAFERYKRSHHETGAGEPMYDFAIALGGPLVTFMFAQLIHGNGFLAAFIAGLLGNFNRGAPVFHSLIHSMETKIESVAKPTIFMMVGPFVALPDLVHTAGLGLLVSLLFILVARPLAVLLSLLPTSISLKEKLFLCAVRETGVIPVVLAVMTVAQFPEMTQLMPLTAWVVIWTLTLLPAITPWWSRKLNILE
jgi:NhaP-type Na+/H+ or K+/H+ antiporter